MWVDNSKKKQRLFELLRDPDTFHPPMLIFVDSKIGAELLADAITKVQLLYMVYDEILTLCD